MEKQIETMTVRQAASLARCDVKTIYNAIHAGELPVITISQRKRLLLAEDVRKWRPKRIHNRDAIS